MLWVPLKLWLELLPLRLLITLILAWGMVNLGRLSELIMTPTMLVTALPVGCRLAATILRIAVVVLRNEVATVCLGWTEVVGCWLKGGSTRLEATLGVLVIAAIDLARLEGLRRGLKGGSSGPETSLGILVVADVHLLGPLRQILFLSGRVIFPRVEVRHGREIVSRLEELDLAKKTVYCLLRSRGRKW